MRTTTDKTSGKPIAFRLQAISGVSAVNPLVAFYIHGRKGEVLLLRLKAKFINNPSVKVSIK
jgi:hypothetical protein